MKEREEVISIIGAREHNLKNINLTLPRNKLIVITGISGSGKSSLAFDTLYAEGQRRYMESFSAYARSFLGDMRRPEVDKIDGLSPVIAIEQKTTSRNPRSTVGTITEIYDFFRLLYARVGVAHSYLTGNKMEKQTEEQIIDIIHKNYKNQQITLLGPIVKGRKGHYRELFVQIRKQGYTKVRVDGVICELKPRMQLDRYKTHDIEVIIDRLLIAEKENTRIRQSIHLALKQGDGLLMVLNKDNSVSYYSKNLMDVETGLSYDEPAPNTFSFNSPYGVCPVCNGAGITKEISTDLLIPDPSLSLKKGGIVVLGKYRPSYLYKEIEFLYKVFKVSINTPLNKIPKDLYNTIIYGQDMGEVDDEEEEEEDSNDMNLETEDDYMAWAELMFSKNFYGFEGLFSFISREMNYGTQKAREKYEPFYEVTTCYECNGQRLRKEALHFLIANKNIGEVSNMNIDALAEWTKNLPQHLDERQQLIASEILKELIKRIGFLEDVGLNYLSLMRPVRSLSGGESQRIRLATQIGTQLVNVLYILDEPSIGLHQRDNEKLIKALKDLRDLGNTIVVVEHDKDMMLQADVIIDIGPGAGIHGGEVVGKGSPNEILKQKSITAAFLSNEKQINLPIKRRAQDGRWIQLLGAEGNNLKSVDLSIPIGNLVVITGVSGSGKSTLIHETLYPLLKQELYKSVTTVLPYKEIEGVSHLDKVIEVDQSPIGRTPRSNPATYTGVFSDIRNLFTQLPEAKIRGYKPGRFSFNVKGGRCETCQGGGMRLIEMDFLEDVLVPCETCKTKRYNRETLEVRFRAKSISDVLNMTVSQAVDFFEHHPKIAKKLKTLEEVGLGYITLGQHATTLSGGEAQRVKLASELCKRDTGKTIYILDEPSTGLHFQDIEHLLSVIQRLVDKGNTVLIIEHNMDIIKVADYIIDLGPEGGEQGGEIVAQGTPEGVAKVKDSHTGRFLEKELRED